MENMLLKIKDFIFKIEWGARKEELILNEEDKEMFDWFYNSDNIDYTDIEC